MQLFRLVQTPPQAGLLTFAKGLVTGIESGIVTGLGVIVTLRPRQFYVDCLGEVERDPTWARGACANLDDRLRAIELRDKIT